MKGEPEVALARQIDKASAELAGSMSELVRPEVAWWFLLRLSSAGAAQIHVLRLVAAGLHRMTQMPQDRFVDPSEDPDDVIDRMAGHLTRAEDLIQRAVTALHDARTEIEELQTLP
ncbi:hypothetical protein ACGFIF_38100 [Kribbella sp. NPDC049174]|uniref:hypothetical protein n=1 Tax=Kribbella sp. NPDC049174 TaxID=3364112 RepID=UPI00371F8439